MKILRSLTCIFLIALFAQSCEPEEINEKSTTLEVENISADTGEYTGGKVEDSRGN